MPDPRKTWRPGDPPIPRWSVKVDQKHKDITVSRRFLQTRDGNRNPAEGDRVQIVVDSRNRHRGLVPDGETSTHRYRNYRLKGITHEASGEERYQLEEER